MIDLFNLDKSKVYITILKEGQEDINNINIIILLLLYLKGHIQAKFYDVKLDC